MHCPPVKMRNAAIGRIFVTARVFVPAYRIRTGVRSLQEGGQIVIAILVADRANKLPIQCQTLELRNIRIPPLDVTRNWYTIQVVFVAEFIVDQVAAKDAIN